MTQFMIAPGLWKIEGELKPQNKESWYKASRHTVVVVAEDFAKVAEIANDALLINWSPLPHEARVLSINKTTLDDDWRLLWPVPETAPNPQAGVELDAYEIANLRALFEACGYGKNAIKPTPLSSLQTGDWMGQIFQKLPAVDYKPNQSPEQMVANVRHYGFPDGPEKQR